MANESFANLTVAAQSEPNLNPHVSLWSVWTTVWCVGLGVSSTCTVLQGVILIVTSKCRKYDEIILTQLNIARVLNAAIEFCILNGIFFSKFFKDFVFTILFHTDFVIVCFMFLFSKNLYNKVVLVFTPTTKNLTVASTLVWTLSLPVGLICPFLISKPNTAYFFIYWKVYASVKLVILVLNACIFVGIFSVVFRRGLNNARTGKEGLKAAAVGFLLVFVTSLQVFANDLLSCIYQDNTTLAYRIGVVNSFQGVPVTIIFIILAKSKIRQSMRSIWIRLREFTV